MVDEIIRELWIVKDTIAKEANYDVDLLIDLLQTRQKQREKSMGQADQPSDKSAT